jgi:TonB family protein
LLFENNVLQQAWYFHNNGNKSAYEVYEKNKLVSSTTWDEDGKLMGGDYKDSVFKSGYRSYKDYLEVNFDRNLPKAYSKGEIHGKVSIEFMIDIYGFVRDAKVRKTSGYPELDNHALNIINNSPRFDIVRMHGRRFVRRWIQPFSYDSMNPNDY